VGTVSLQQIWHESPAFNAFRGDSWMREPCSTCDERTVDHGGCRCQAYLLTGNTSAADPVCSKSEHHGKVEQVVKLAHLDDRNTGQTCSILKSAPSSRLSPARGGLKADPYPTVVRVRSLISNRLATCSYASAVINEVDPVGRTDLKAPYVIPALHLITDTGCTATYCRFPSWHTDKYVDNRRYPWMQSACEGTRSFIALTACG
jgi:hypothetical protein